MVRKGIENENLQDLEMKIDEQLSQELETALKGQFKAESANNDSETLHDKINKAIDVQTLSKKLVKNDDISVKDLERSETQNIIKKLVVNGVKYEDIMPSSESTTNARDEKKILYNSIN